LLLALKPTKSEEILKLYPPVTISDERDALEITATSTIRVALLSEVCPVSYKII
jgi:hypothetical protein